MQDMIDITGVDLPLFVKTVYALSKPQGLGFIHFQEGELDAETLNNIIENGHTNQRFAVCTDYIHGRACKMNVWKENDRLYIRKAWYDHTQSQLEQLLTICGIVVPDNLESGV